MSADGIASGVLLLTVFALVFYNLKQLRRVSHRWRALFICYLVALFMACAANVSLQLLTAFATHVFIDEMEHIRRSVFHRSAAFQYLLLMLTLFFAYCVWRADVVAESSRDGQ